MKLYFAIFFSAFAAASAQQVGNEVRDTQAAVEAIRSNHESRMARLAEMIEERRQLKEDHESGRRRLSDEEYDRASRQYLNFQRKLEQMKMRTAEDHIERLEELRSLHGMKYAEFVDLKEKLENRN